MVKAWLKEVLANPHEYPPDPSTYCPAFARFVENTNPRWGERLDKATVMLAYWWVRGDFTRANSALVTFRHLLSLAEVGSGVPYEDSIIASSRKPRQRERTMP